MQASTAVAHGLSWPWHAESSRIRDKTHVPWIGRQTLKPLDHRGSPNNAIFNIQRLNVSSLRSRIRLECPLSLYLFTVVENHLDAIVVVSRSVVSDSLRPQVLQPARLLCTWDSPGKNTRVDCYSLLQSIFPTQGSNPGLLHHRQILYHLSHQRSLQEGPEGELSSE